MMALSRSNARCWLTKVNRKSRMAYCFYGDAGPMPETARQLKDTVFNLTGVSRLLDLTRGDLMSL
jgi:hypothetical protein